MSTTLQLGSRYRVPSGMGGVFDVRLLELHDDGSAQVRIDMPGNRDWHDYLVTVRQDNIAPIPVRHQVRTRVGKLTGEPGDYLCWGTYATRAEAEAGEKAAALFPKCHPIKIVEIEG